MLLSDEFLYKPFNVNRMCFDIISRHSVNRWNAKLAYKYLFIKSAGSKLQLVMVCI